MARLWIITYDIRHPKRLRAVAEALEAVAERVQESVFECWADRHRVAVIRQELAALIEPTEDSVRFYPLCGSCIGRMRWQGEGFGPGGASYWVV